MSIDGKVCIVTGANAGTGKATAVANESNVAQKLWQVSAQLTGLLGNFAKFTYGRVS